ncbi:hypothetical protein B9Z19DRAFT_1141335 [Tuber borchii]|uniref:dolichyl-phosphate beta-D-mannosyltransferase n=1 Tax=Tuber borchii TaxID=42251 RepID=A0A2T6ZTH5_TUBBO|nr:hypothetical protein B9Z19DRAFT_1141335 [Tuber borchii]
MAPSQPTKSGKDKYTVVPPTYNERKDFPIIAWFLEKTFTERTQVVENQLNTVYGANRLLKPPTGKPGPDRVYLYRLHFAMGNFVTIMYADLWHHPKFIADFITLQKTKDYDIVTGTRYAGNGGVYRWDFKREFRENGGCL